MLFSSNFLNGLMTALADNLFLLSTSTLMSIDAFAKNNEAGLTRQLALLKYFDCAEPFQIVPLSVNGKFIEFIK